MRCPVCQLELRVEGVTGVVVSALARVERNGLALKTPGTGASTGGKKELDVVVMLAERLHLVIRQLRERRENRQRLDVKDEYDVQDLFHALLTINFDDIREEEWTPSYGGRGLADGFSLTESSSGNQEDAAKSIGRPAWRSAYH